MILLIAQAMIGRWPRYANELVKQLVNQLVTDSSQLINLFK
ncbi:MAG: polymerase basic protein 2 [Moorea sp. SIO1F2]|nr:MULTISPECIES: hypothetical protein [unclassified Moorena]NEN96460.1 polymerase basic protein 2 [Moorena sp. SIO3I7]NEO65086.1 polymerase basic protein 2 [Moorena sp. SIO4G2]NEO07934.1 polymerase basic protein 2 [Moorena sp. SIO3I8]NEO22565.1 polymerase basic protein 2 [Moorena sp. SIO4A5]NEP25310.1 polymerase basic protein 2 [Moorena sp. SIO3I6]